MNKICKNIFATALATTLLSSLAINSYAAEKDYFTDVPSTHQYYESIQFLAENKIVQGVGGGIFQPDRNITLHEFAILLRNSFAPSEMVAGALPVCFVKNWIPMYIVSKNPSETLIRGDIYTVVSRVEGINVYSESGPGIRYSDYVRTMQELGLANEGVSESDFMTRGEAADIIQKLLNNEYQTTMPDSLKEIKIESTKTQNIGMYQSALDSIPDAVLKKFNETGWKLVIDDKEVYRLNDENKIMAHAWTDYSARTIFIKSIGPVMHEFGHFIDWYAEFPEMDMSEAEIFESKFNYNCHNRYEYFASYFAHLMRVKDDMTEMNYLKANTPHTFECFARNVLLKDIIK